MINAAVSLLAGIPSVVYGLVGMLVLVPAIRSAFNIPDGASLLAAIIVLAIMILPSIIKVSVTALEAVPKEYEDASLALGATPVETYFRVSVPAAKSGIAAAVVLPSCVDGIITGCILSVGRILGESAALLFTAGFAHALNGFFEGLGSSGATLTVALYVYAKEQGEFEVAFDNAVQDGRSEIEVSRNGHEYQLNISRIGSDEQTSGVVILVFDISDKVFAERNRKEFTANVSHELKTPLQSIMGSAELLENGLVKADDVPKFIGRIRSEAARLVTLIEDIIRLSQLDESTDFPFEDADIYEIAKDEAEMLSLTAQKRNVTISVKGKSTVIHAPKQLLHEIIYNLCDNAIKYNKEGGSVEVSVEESDNNVILSVSDTGIGIPLDNQSRVFERFYRVDKSHSKETGGTGLGLSIVKHAVQYLNGKISLESIVGKGTKISVAFRV